jgi:hypothetical protein
MDGAAPLPIEGNSTSRTAKPLAAHTPSAATQAIGMPVRRTKRTTLLPSAAQKDVTGPNPSGTGGRLTRETAAADPPGTRG